MKKSSGWFSKGAKEVKMSVADAAKNVRYTLAGSWDRGMSCKDEQTG